VDELGEQESAVSLMTLHCAKGLEFKAVIIVGLEEDIFPNARAVNEENRLEEERRLFYVGMTRARESLLLTRSETRVWYGETRWQRPSMFLSELRPELLERFKADEGVARAFSGGETGGRRRASGKERSRRHGYGPATASAGLQRMVGRRARHPVLGEGVITGLRGTGNSLSLILVLDDGRTHQLLARYSNLEIIDAP
jgi:DNA helicase-2/ATP-dependent DNA helicase PcrA